MLPSCFDYIFVHSRQKARLRPELSPKFLSTLGPNPNPTRKARLDLQLCTGEATRNLSCTFVPLNEPLQVVAHEGKHYAV